MSDTEREDLAALVTSPGWQRVTAWVRADLAANMAQHTERAANDTDDVAALNKLRQVIAAKRAVEIAIGYPDARLKELAAKAAGEDRTPSLSRGGIR